MKKKSKKKYKCGRCGEKQVVCVAKGYYECRSCGGAGDKEGMLNG